MKKKLGDLLVDAGLISQETLKEALGLQKETNQKLGEVLTNEGFITEQQIIEVLEFQLGIPHMDLDRYFIDPEIPRLISENLARRHTLIPIKRERDYLLVAMMDPLNIYAIDDVRIATGVEVKPAISTKQSLLDAIDQYYGKQSAEQAIEDYKKQYYGDSQDIDERLLDEINNAPVVRLVNSIIKQAQKAGASDIHIEPLSDIVRIRFRVDGDLYDVMSPSKSTFSAIVTRIKIMGKMNIAERRLPQDGRVEIVDDGKVIDLRISILPTDDGEKIVMRLLNRDGFLMSRDSLGFSEANGIMYDAIIKNPHGIILITGPTGSGKSTTLYSILKELDQASRNIITVEDPVEYKIDGINQISINEKVGLTFKTVLKSILRQDPDIIMIGEIRDIETAQIAVRAAITGHLVLSTMHTNDTASTVMRLVDMGIPPYLVSSSVVGVISQRLVKKICTHCKEAYTPSPSERSLLDLEEGTLLYRGKGCSYCKNKGYKGREAIHEIMPVIKELRQVINENGHVDELKRVATTNGLMSIQESCKELVLRGIATIDEMLRTTYTMD